MEQTIAPAILDLQHNGIPELVDLLPKLSKNLSVKMINGNQPLSFEEQKVIEKVKNATENALAPILHGISGIGELMSQGAEEASSDTILHIGWLLSTLGNQAVALNFLASECDYFLNRSELIKAQKR